MPSMSLISMTGSGLCPSPSKHSASCDAPISPHRTIRRQYHGVTARLYSPTEPTSGSEGRASLGGGTAASGAPWSGGPAAGSAGEAEAKGEGDGPAAPPDLGDGSVRRQPTGVAATARRKAVTQISPQTVRPIGMATLARRLSRPPASFPRSKPAGLGNTRTEAQGWESAQPNLNTAVAEPLRIVRPYAGNRSRGPGEGS
jgi:hypothetical protein